MEDQLALGQQLGVGGPCGRRHQEKCRQRQQCRPGSGQPQLSFLRNVVWQPPQPSLPRVAKAASVALTSPLFAASASFSAKSSVLAAAALKPAASDHTGGRAQVGPLSLPGGNMAGVYSAVSLIASAWNSIWPSSSGYSVMIALMAVMWSPLAFIVACLTATTPVAFSSSACTTVPPRTPKATAAIIRCFGPINCSPGRRRWW